MAYCQMDAQMSEKYITLLQKQMGNSEITIYEGTSSGTKKTSLPRLLRVSVYSMRTSDPLFSETMFPRLATGTPKHFVCFPLI